MNETEKKQEKELLEGYKRLPPDLQNFILSTVITAVTAQEAALREYALRIGHQNPSNPIYAKPGSGPRMGTALAEEALNG